MTDSRSALARQIYLYIIDLISAGELELLEEAGLTHEQVDKFASMRTLEAQVLFQRRAQMFEIKANQSVINALLKDVERQRLIDDCIKAGAPNQFLYGFFGLDARDATKRRRAFGIQANYIQRFPRSIQQSTLIEQQYIKLLGDRDFEDFTAEDYYQLYLNLRELGQEASIKAIWQAVHKLNEDGLEDGQVKIEAGEA